VLPRHRRQCKAWACDEVALTQRLGNRPLQVVAPGQSVAVIGDGKLGLLVAQLLLLHGASGLVHFGRHARKLGMVAGSTPHVVNDATAAEFRQVSQGCRLRSPCSCCSWAFCPRCLSVYASVHGRDWRRAAGADASAEASDHPPGHPPAFPDRAWR
jgi:threonine dehydrogenase-like Zn-dependent dehydrogenase